jgi:hypothetical protein
MTRRAFRSSLAAMSLGAAVVVFGCPADAEARPGGGTRSMALGAQSNNAARAAIKPKWGRSSQQIDKRNASIAKQTTMKRRTLRGKTEPAKNQVFRLRDVAGAVTL